MIARFQAGRRQVELIRAFAKVERTLNAGAFLALIGKGETQAEIEAAIAEEKIGDRVRLYGFRDADLPEAIASLDATVLLKEGSDAGCRAVLQSLACGVPVIGARVPAITEALEGSGAGWLIDPVDLEALEGALREAILRGPEQRSTMATAARSKVLAAYTERARVERIAEIVRAVTSPRAEPR
jgi:glycosyltransferase involved in cell wall biosynthesis